MNGWNGMQMVGRLNQPICCMFDSRPCSAQQHAATLLQMSTTNPHFYISLSATFHPGHSPTEGRVSVSGCTDAGPSLLVARRELMVMSQLLPAPIPRHMTLYRTQTPFVRPQVTHNPAALSQSDP